MNFANFVCRFGDDLVMLDLAEQVVLPAFMSDGERRYGDSTYFFQSVSLENFGTKDEPELVLVGRLVLDTVLSRDQVLKDGVLVRDHASMPSAPSALFALVMDTHKLLYLPETRFAPSLSAFRATAARLIKDRHKLFIREQWKLAKRQDPETTKRSIFEKYPMPTVEVVPLSSDASLEQFMKQFKILRQVRIELVEPNDEIDTSPLLKRIRQGQETVGATSAVVSYTNADGLSQAKTAEELGPVVEEGNAKVTLSGVDALGDRLIGNNDRFKLSMPIDEIPNDPKGAGRDLYDVFKAKVGAGLLKVQKVRKDVREKIARLSKR